MIDVDLHNIFDFLEMDLFQVSPIYPITKEHHFKLMKGVSVTLSNGDLVQIPKGFKFDGSSSPRFIWWLFPSYGDFLFAALIHDYLYHIKYRSEDVGMDYAQQLADKEMLVWSMLINNKNIGKRIDNKERYQAVKWFGKKQYKD